ncbi:MAG: AAA family ATPase [Cyanobacteria bacterium]|nr:AAA family ATPase [Cyanobacteriota bacterium]
MSAPASGTSEASEASLPPHDERMRKLRELAKNLIDDQGIPSDIDRLSILRKQNEILKLKLNENELKKILWEARRLDGERPTPLVGGCKIVLHPTEWLLDQIIQAGVINLLVAMPKTGKTRLIIRIIKALLHGEGIFLGRALNENTPYVLIFGNDQTSREWSALLLDNGLINDANVLTEKVSIVYCKESPEYLDEQGIAKMSAWAKQYPNGIILIDSLATCMPANGVSENDAEFVQPLALMQEKVAPYGATVIVIHHTSKTENAKGVLASRGTSALPALCSQILYLRHVNEDQSWGQEKKLILSTESRAAQSVEIYLTMGANGEWSAQSTDNLREERQRKKTIEKLTSRQTEAYDQLIITSVNGLTAKNLQLVMSFDGGDEERKARATLDQLATIGLAKKKDISYGPSGGRGVIYYDSAIKENEIQNTTEEDPEAPEGNLHVTRPVEEPADALSDCLDGDQDEYF